VTEGKIETFVLLSRLLLKIADQPGSPYAGIGGVGWIGIGKGLPHTILLRSIISE
jgi:hypothetical protein